MREQDGINSHAFLAAPSPDNNPIINVPRTTKRDKAEETKLVERSASGSGIIDRTKRYSEYGRRAMKIRVESERRRDSLPMESKHDEDTEFSQMHSPSEDWYVKRKFCANGITSSIIASNRNSDNRQFRTRLLRDLSVTSFTE